jgi:hypothetical protein
MCSCSTIAGMVDFRNFTAIRATIIDAPLKESEGGLR